MSQISKNARAVNQHYVPAGYLRGFVPDGEKALFVCRRTPRKWFRQVPENIATRKNFYSVLKEGVWDDRLEKFLATQIEGPGLRALHRFNSEQNTISSIDRERVCLLLAMQYLRIPQFRSDIERTLETFLHLYADRAFENVQRIQRDLQLLQGMGSEEAATTAREIRRLQRTGGIEVKLRREAGLPYMFGLLVDISKIFFGMEWTVMLADRPTFFTSDIPVHIFPGSVREGEHVALADPRTVIHAPLSSRRLLTLTNYGKHAQRRYIVSLICGELFASRFAVLPPVISYRQPDERTARNLNSATCRTALEWVCGPFAANFIDEEIEKQPSRLTLELHVNRSQVNVRQTIKTVDSSAVEAGD